MMTISDDDIDHVQAIALSHSDWSPKSASKVAKVMGFTEFEQYKAVYRAGKLAIATYKHKGKVWDD
jgi:hypothetical protein